MKTFNILPKARWLVTITLLLSLCIPHVWGAEQTITLNFYDESKLSSTSGTNVSITYARNQTTCSDNSLDVDDVITASSYTGTVQYGKNGGVTFGANSTAAAYWTLTFANDFEFYKVEIVGAHYETNNFTVNGDAADSGALNAKGTKLADCTNTLVWEKESGDEYSGAITFRKTATKRATIYTITLYYDDGQGGGCSNAVSLSKGSESHGEVTTISSASVATCSETASDRRVTITVTPDDCYDAPSTLTWTKSSGTVSASKQSGPTDNGDGTYSYVYQFAQNDNGAGTFGVTCTAKAAGKTVNFDAGPGVSASSSLTETCSGSGVTLPAVTATGVCKGWTTFAGWATAPVTDSTTTSGVTLYAAGSNYVPASNNMTLYAVYSKVKGGGSSTLTIYPSTYTNKGTNNYGSGAERTGTVGTINLGAHYVTGNASGTPGGSSAGDFLQCQGSNANIYNKTALPGKITQVVLNQNSATAFSLYCGTEQLMASNNTSTGQTPSGTAQTAQSAATQMTWTVSGNYTYFDLKKGSSAGYVSSIVVTYSSSATYYCSDPNCASCSADPSAGTASLNGSFSLTSVGVQATSASSGANCTYSDYGFLWSETISEAASLKLNESTGAAPSGATKVTVGNSGNVTSFTGALEKSSFEVGHTYYYRSYAHNNKDAGTYQYSSVVSFTPRSVTFNLNGHGTSTPSTQYVNNGGKATDPSYSESVAGWTFGGWYDNEGCTGSAWNFSSNTVSGANVTLYAKWTEKPKYTITLNAGNGTISDVNWTNTSGSTYTRTQSNGDEAITLPTPSCGCAGWVFKGWSTTSKDNAGSFTPDKTDGASFTPTSDVTYYAVYRQSTPSGTTYTKITEAAALTTGDYLIVANNDGGSNYYAMANSITSGHMTETSSTNATSWSNPSTTAVWTVIKFRDKVGFYNASADNNNGKYLTIVDGAWVLADDGQLFSYSFNSTTKAWTFTSPSGKQMVYTSYFYTGDAQDDPIYLYKRGDAESGNYYTNPSCSDYSVTGVANPAAGGSVQLTAAAAKNGDKVWACYTADPEYNFTNWSISGTSVSPTSATTQFVEITVGSGDVTATANFTAKVMYNVTWKANGDALTGEDLGSASVRVENGHNITTLPPAPTSCETGSGKSDVFMGWCNMDWSGYKDDPEHFPVGAVLYASASEMPAVTGDVTYHAVWAQAGTTPVSYTLDFAISNSVGSATAFTAFKTGLTNAATNNTYWDADNITTSGIIYQDANASGQVGPRFGSGSNTGTIVMPLLAAGQVVPTSIAASVKRYGSDAAVKFKIKAHFTDATEVETELPSSGYVAADFTTYTATYSNGKTLDKITIYTTTSSQRMYLASITVTANAMTKYLTKCCTTPTLAFAASPYATIRQDIHGASSSTWAEVDVTFTTNSSGTISVPDYGSGKSVYKLSSWEGRGTTVGTLCTTDHAYFELGETPGTGTLHVKTTTGYTGQGTYRIAITQAATDAEHGNYCEATVYGFVDVTLRDKFVDNVNDNEGPVNKDGHGAQVATPTLSEFGTQVENACHSEGRKLKGWIKETDLQTLYESGTPASTRVQTIDGLCESCSAGSDQTSLIKAPGANITTSGATWYAVWAYEK